MESQPVQLEIVQASAFYRNSHVQKLTQMLLYVKKKSHNWRIDLKSKKKKMLCPVERENFQLFSISAF